MGDEERGRRNPHSKEYYRASSSATRLADLKSHRASCPAPASVYWQRGPSNSDCSQVRGSAGNTLRQGNCPVAMKVMVSECRVHRDVPLTPDLGFAVPDFPVVCVVSVISDVATNRDEGRVGIGNGLNQCPANRKRAALVFVGSVKRVSPYTIKRNGSPACACNSTGCVWAHNNGSERHQQHTTPEIWKATP